jgi:acyl-CoA synthetase (AMP-forming)/AMP-acid ligase II/thioesterase domain-containing protein
LCDVLEHAAAAEPTKGLIIYPSGNATSATRVTYAELSYRAQNHSHILEHIEGFGTGKPVLIYLNDHLEILTWFWATIFAGAHPTVISPFSNISSEQNQQIAGLGRLLARPLVITKESSKHVFSEHDCVRVHTVETLLLQVNGDRTNACKTNGNVTHGKPRGNDLAILMLTSGSTGNAKAVRLSHGQVLSAVDGKIAFRALPAGKPFLNWIGLDHVASVVEIHLPAMRLGVDQVHIQATDIIASPRLFLDLLSEHQVARTFAPNFFMAKLISTVRPDGEATAAEGLDLRYLTWMGSGGEANDLDVCVALTDLFTKCGTISNVIVPGFGMTETCAGCIYNLDCPQYDILCNTSFASLGRPIQGVEMRVTLPELHEGQCGIMVAEHGVPGNLEIRGAVVFDGYYDNPEATDESFAPGGWFKTGDQAMIDTDGHLHMIGRVKETLNINGVKYLPQDIEAAVEQVLTSRVASRVICFPIRARGAHTEGICIVYVATHGLAHDGELGKHRAAIVQSTMLQASTQPYVLGLSDESVLPKTTLGKISRAKLRTMFESGLLEDQVRRYEDLIRSGQRESAPESGVPDEAEQLIIDDFAAVLGTPPGLDAWSLDIPIFDVGATSIDLIRLKKHIGDRFKVDIPVITLMLNPTARSLATALLQLSTELVATTSRVDSHGTNTGYKPVVTLRPTSPEAQGTPLWLIHPGVGEVLVFLALAKHIPSPPVYALRARGFEPGETYFTDIDEAVSTYHSAIKTVQPHGPYAIAGYSYGAMLAFEVAKRLGYSGDSVPFLGSFNLPPHIKTRMRQLGWAACLLHLCYFLDLLTEDTAGQLQPAIEALDEAGQREAALAAVLDKCSPDRLAELQLDAAALENWALLAHRLQGMARDYEPSGTVAAMDVFQAIPLREAARDRRDWVENHLGKWADFVRAGGEPVFHEVGGAHYTMLGPEHVEGFAQRLIAVLKERGV